MLSQQRYSAAGGSKKKIVIEGAVTSKKYKKGKAQGQYWGV
jgi:hypothetical protein